MEADASKYKISQASILNRLVKVKGWKGWNCSSYAVSNGLAGRCSNTVRRPTSYFVSNDLDAAHELVVGNFNPYVLNDVIADITSEERCSFHQSGWYDRLPQKEYIQALAKNSRGIDYQFAVHATAEKTDPSNNDFTLCKYRRWCEANDSGIGVNHKRSVDKRTHWKKRSWPRKVPRCAKPSRFYAWWYCRSIR